MVQLQQDGLTAAGAIRQLVQRADGDAMVWLARALTRLIETCPEMDHIAWQALATVAVGCERTIVRHYALGVVHQVGLIRALAWSIAYLQAHASERRDAAVEAFLRFCTIRERYDQEIVLQARRSAAGVLNAAELNRLESQLSSPVPRHAKHQPVARPDVTIAPPRPSSAPGGVQSEPLAQIPNKQATRELHIRESAATKLVPSHESNLAEQWLSARGLARKGPIDGMYTNQGFQTIAAALGSEYEVLRDLHRGIVQTVTSGMTTAIIPHVAGRDQLEAYQSFCALLQHHDLIKSYGRHKAWGDFSVELRCVGNQVKFITGAWFELYVYQKLTAYLKQLDVPYASTVGYQTMLPDRKAAEIDIFLLFKEQPVLIECKSGRNPETFDRFVKIIQHLHLGANRVFCVILNAEPIGLRRDGQRYGFGVVQLRELLHAIRSFR